MGKTSLWVEIFTGQNKLNYIQSKIKRIEPICRFREEEDKSFFHILNECPCFREMRCEILQSQATTIENGTIEKIQKFVNHGVIKVGLCYNPDLDLVWKTIGDKSKSETGIGAGKTEPSFCSP